jgi:hypothetical protein
MGVIVRKAGRYSSEDNHRAISPKGARQPEEAKGQRRSTEGLTGKGALVSGICIDLFWTSPTKKFFPSNFCYPTLKTRARFDPRATFALATAFGRKIRN